MTVNGNLESLKDSVINELEGLYDLEYDKTSFVPEELAARLADLTGRINREISVFINRKGNILDISVGDNSTVPLPLVEGRRGQNRLSGIRCIHTHPNGDARLSSVDMNSLLSLKMDAMIALGVKDGTVTGIYAALPGQTDSTDMYGPFMPGDRRLDALAVLVAEREKAMGAVIHENADEEERAILVGLETTGGRLINGRSPGERSLDELEELAATAGAITLQKVLQRKTTQDSGYYIGKGKVEELSLLRQALNANVIIFDDELSGAQVRNLEAVVGVKVIDRTMLILDIFAQRAGSREGKLQVELAQLKYRLPRLIGLGTQLSRLGGGIGTRGPGERKLDVDRRHIRRRMHYLEDELKVVGTRRTYLREGRKRNALPVIALVGYTNVGKSTLMNRLCNADVFTENKLFATLDPTTRKLVLPDEREALLIDTVGFIRKLPHDLVKAFKSTLEEAVYADILLHVVDASSEEADEQIAVVNDILNNLGALQKESILVLNKIDLGGEEPRISGSKPGQKTYPVSAVTGQGLAQLLEGLQGMIPSTEVEVKVEAPYNQGWIAPYIHENGRILEESYTETGSLIRAVVDIAKLDRLKDFVVD
jgi:GTPase